MDNTDLKCMSPDGCGYMYKLDENGLVQPFDFVLPAVQDLRARFALRGHDVVIATYPKCGTTWMQQLVLLLVRGSDTDVAPMRDAPWLEMSVSSAASGEPSSSPPLSVDELRALPAPPQGRLAVWKTHSTAALVPWCGGVAAAAAAAAKVVVVSRSPKDTAVSMLHHTANIPGFGFTGGWEEFAPLFLSGRVESSSFWEWHRGWWEAARAHARSVLWVRFEEMKRDLLGVTRRVAEHLGLQRSEEEVCHCAVRPAASYHTAAPHDRPTCDRLAPRSCSPWPTAAVSPR